MCKNSLTKKIKTDFFQKSTFFESPITHKRFIFEHSYNSYGKRQKSCCLIVILVILSYLTSTIFNSSSKSIGFYCKRGSTNKKPILNSTFPVVIVDGSSDSRELIFATQSMVKEDGRSHWTLRTQLHKRRLEKDIRKVKPV